jgi:4'-phosphopantetheinyl transferase
LVKVIAMRIPVSMDPGIFEKLKTMVSEEKRKRISRFKFASDAYRTLLADIVLRYELCAKLQMRNDELRFVTNPFGKPFLDNVPSLMFNLSHSGDWVVCALDREPVGIDIEQIRPIDLDIAERYFSELEYQDLMSEKDRIKYFYDLWSLKESYVKMIGTGLSASLDSFSIRKTENGTIQLTVHADKPELIRGAKFAQFEMGTEYRLSVCSVSGQFPPQCKTYDFTEVAAWAEIVN